MFSFVQTISRNCLTIPKQKHQWDIYCTVCGPLGYPRHMQPICNFFCNQDENPSIMHHVMVQLVLIFQWLDMDSYLFYEAIICQLWSVAIMWLIEIFLVFSLIHQSRCGRWMLIGLHEQIVGERKSFPSFLEWKLLV